MKVIEKPLMVGGFEVGKFLAYEDIEPEFVALEPRTRVLPAQFFYEKGLYFELIKKHEPGERGFPNGGYTVRSEFGQVRNYDLDQVIIHPAILKHRKTLDKMTRRAEKETKKRDKRIARAEKALKPKYGKRGRPALSDEARAAKEAAKVARSKTSGGKRGRPASLTPKAPKVPKATGGRRGRPALSAEQIAVREAAKAATAIRSGGKRGRPASLNPKPKKEPSGLGRGRPSTLKKRKRGKK